MAHQAEPDEQDRQVVAWGISLARTVVPAVWGLLLDWLISLGVSLPTEVAAALQLLLGLVLVSAWYGLWRLVEHLLPPWATRLVLGANTAPAYSPTPPGGS